MLRLILNSVLKASTLSPFRICWAMALRNSTLNTRTAIRTSVRCSLSLFSVSQVWGPHHDVSVTLSLLQHRLKGTAVLLRLFVGAQFTSVVLLYIARRQQLMLDKYRARN